jgi:hypothetical protein
MKPVRRKSRKQTTYRFAKSAQGFARGLLGSLGIVLMIMVIAVFFIFYQWKEVRINKSLKNIQTLNLEILSLNSQKSRLETRRNELIKQIPVRAKNELGMVLQVKRPDKINVKKSVLDQYETKDKFLSE